MHDLNKNPLFLFHSSPVKTQLAPYPHHNVWSWLLSALVSEYVDGKLSSILLLLFLLLNWASQSMLTLNCCPRDIISVVYGVRIDFQ